MSSVANMLRRVVRGERAGGCVLDVVTIIGFDRVMFGGSIARPESSSSSSSSSADVPAEGPIGGDVLERCRSDVDFDARFANAAARSG